MSKIMKRSRTYCQQFCKYSSVKSTNDKSVQAPVSVQYDVIGQPDKHSNLRPVKMYVDPQENSLQREYRKLRIETQEWNQKFWSEHNQRFIKERERFVASNKTEGESIPNADQMSVFYKNFLDDNWKGHVVYNAEWYRRNVRILGLAIRVHMNNIWNKIKG